MSPRITKIIGILAGTLALFVMFFVVTPYQISAQILDDGGSDLPACTGEIGEIDGVTCEWPDIPYPNPGDTGSPAAAATASSTNNKEPVFGCTIFNGLDGFKACGAALAYTIMSFFAVLLGIAGILLNGAVELTVQNMAVFVNGPNGTTTAIEVAWKLFRDIGNVIILFVLLFSSIGVILRTDVLVPKGTLAKIILAAFLINFSLFFTKIIIDVSNVFTFTIHNEIEQISSTNDDALVFGVAGAFMNGLNPVRIYRSMQEELRRDSNAQLESRIFQQMLMGTIVILIAAFVFLVMAGMLLIRFAILMMLLVTSPIGVIGMLIPKLKQYSQQWWSTLIGQAMFAPVLMLFMLITILLINKGGFMAALSQSAPSSSNFDSYIAQNLSFSAGDISLVMQYVIIIALMIMGLVIAKSVAGKFGSGAVDWVSKKAGSVAFGGIAAAGSYGIGKFGSRIAESELATNLQTSKSFASRLVGRGLINTGKYIGNASYDMRGVKAVGGVAGKAAPGYIKRMEEEKKRIAAATKNLKTKDTTKEERAALEAEMQNVPEIEKAARAKQKEIDAAREAEQGLKGLALVDAKARTKQAEDALTATDKRVIAVHKDKKWKDQDQRMKDLEKLSIDLAEKREKEAKSEIAELAQVLKTHEMQQARDIVKAMGEEKDPQKKKDLLKSLNENQQKFVLATEKLGAAQKQAGDIQKSTQLAWADRNIEIGGSIGDAVRDIRKEQGKSKASKILEDFLKESEKPSAPPPPASPATPTP